MKQPSTRLDRKKLTIISALLALSAVDGQWRSSKVIAWRVMLICKELLSTEWPYTEKPITHALKTLSQTHKIERRIIPYRIGYPPKHRYADHYEYKVRQTYYGCSLAEQLKAIQQNA